MDARRPRTDGREPCLATVRRAGWVWIAALAVAVGVSWGQPPSAEEQNQAGPRVPIGSLTPRPAGPGWIDLLSPEHAGGWRANVRKAKLFEIDDETMRVFGEESVGFVGYMVERLRDFDLHLEFKLAPLTNTGVILRGEPDSPPYSGFEIQIFDDYGRPTTKTSCAALYGVATPMFNLSKPAGEWNSFDVTCKGRVVVVYFNGWKVLDVDLAKMTMPLGKIPTPYALKPLDGYLFFEARGGEAWFRNVLLKKL